MIAVRVHLILRTYLVLVALYWTLLLGGLAFLLMFESLRYLRADVPPLSRVSFVLFAASLWAAAWAVGRTSLAGRVVRWMCVFGLVAALYVWRSVWWYGRLAVWSGEFSLALLLSVLVILVVPELNRLGRRATAKRLAMDVTLATVLAALVVGGYFLYQGWTSAENMRLRAAVVAELAKIELPPGSVFVYEEVEANRNCKTAHISKVFASEMSPIEICTLVAGPLPAKGWAVVSDCHSAAHPFTKSFARLVARMPSGSDLQLEAEPKDTRGPHLMLSTHGDTKAIPLARMAGSALFTIRLDSWEDPERVSRRCPDPGRCECSDSTLFTWRFADGRHLTRSD